MKKLKKRFFLLVNSVTAVTTEVHTLACELRYDAALVFRVCVYLYV